MDYKTEINKLQEEKCKLIEEAAKIEVKNEYIQNGELKASEAKPLLDRHVKIFNRILEIGREIVDLEAKQNASSSYRPII